MRFRIIVFLACTVIVVAASFLRFGGRAALDVPEAPNTYPDPAPASTQANRPKDQSQANDRQPSSQNRVSAQTHRSTTVNAAEADEPTLAISARLDALRAMLPENLYWEFGVPTDDPEVVAERKRFATKIEKVFGLIQSNTATEEEIDWYFDHKERLSRDYLEFAHTVLERYEDELPPREVGLYELSRSMHAHRLREYPKSRRDAKRRKRLQDQKREAWQSSR